MLRKGCLAALPNFPPSGIFGRRLKHSDKEQHAQYLSLAVSRQLQQEDFK